MGLSAWTARRAVRSAHVLVVEVPGHWVSRVCTERVVRERGWHRALSPADADLLVVCGTPGPEMAPLVDRVWDQLPGPRARSVVTDPKGIGAALTRAHDALLDRGRQREDARERTTEPELDHGDTDHGMDMAPGGVSLAEGGEDRDGLEMDVLHLPLGPILAHWPAGLTLRCSLQGDVIVDAEARWVRDRVAADHDALDAAPAGAVRLDNVAGLLALAGWPDAAVRARRLRDDVLRAEDLRALRAELDVLHGRVARSRLLRWSLRGIRPVGAEELADRAWPHAWSGDVHDRLLIALDLAAASLRTDDGGRRDVRDPAAAARLLPDVAAALPHLVTGLDLATARLVVASLDLDPLGMAEMRHA